MITGVESSGFSAKYCFGSSSKEFPERERAQGMVIIVFALVGMVNYSVI